VGIGNAIILGLLQGLTEFLPVSSSGHLVLGKALLGIPEQGIAFEVFVHFGTLLAVVTIFRKDIVNLFQAFFSLFKKSTYSQGFSKKYASDADLRLLIFICLATIPAVIVGLLFEDYVETAFSSPHFVGVTLIITAVILSATFFKSKTEKPMNLLNTFIIGVAQAFAIMPGISRSGSTISFGLFQKMSGNDAARFSFLLAVPAILGAVVLKTSELIKTGISGEFFLVLLVGTIASYISGYIAIETLLSIVRKGKLYLFAPYCLIIGILALVFI